MAPLQGASRWGLENRARRPSRAARRALPPAILCDASGV